MVSVIASTHTSEVTNSSGDHRVGVWTVVVAAGVGQRFGGPKQLLDLGGRRVVDRSVALAARVSESVVVVLPPEVDLGYDEWGSVPIVSAIGGPSRSASVRNGLSLVPDQADVVVIHDGARPLASPELFVKVVQAVRGGADAVVPVVPVVDSVRHRVSGPVDRTDLVAVQTPQAFAAELLRAAHQTGHDATDDATLVEAIGGQVVLVDGEVDNLKITTPHDLLVAEGIVGRRDDASDGQSEESSREDHHE